MGVVLFFVSRILQWILTPVFFIYTVIRLHNFQKIEAYFGNVAFSVDQLGNAMGCVVMNDLFLKKGATTLYGDPDETISYVTGINYLESNLTIFGIMLVKILNKIEENHVENAAKNNQ